MNVTFEVTEAVILTRAIGTDMIWLHTTLPSPFPAVDPTDLKVRFEVRRNHGLEYVQEHLPPDIPIKVIDGETGKQERVQ